ncbi:MAG: CHAT domain-containing protein [Anaerolineae bacterium]
MCSDPDVTLLLSSPLERQRELIDAYGPLWGDDAAEGLKRQADALLRSDLQGALATSALLLRLAELTGDPHHRALGLLAEANARSIGLGEYARAEALYAEAASIYESTGQRALQARAQVGRVWALACQGRYDEAFSVGEWAAQVLEAEGDLLTLGRLLVNMGIIHYRLGQDQEAFAQYTQARSAYQRLPQTEEVRAALARVEHNRHNVLRNLGRFDEALEAGQRALDLLEATGQRIEAARARQNLGVTYFLLGRYNQAIRLLESARDAFWADHRARDTLLADLFLSDCLLQLRRFSEALDKCRRARETFSSLGVRLEVAQALLNEAIAHAGLGQFGEAERSLQDARRLYEEEGNHTAMAMVDLEAAALMQRQEMWEAALDLALRAQQTFRERELPLPLARAHWTAARSLAALGDLDRAEQQLDQAAALFAAEDVPHLAHYLHRLRGQLWRARGAPVAALGEFEHAIELLERLRGRMMIEFRAEFLEDKQEIYEEAVSLCLELDRPEAALEFAERAKSRALVELVAHRLDLSLRARDEADIPLVERLTALRRRRDRLYRRWQSGERPEGQAWEQEAEARESIQREVARLEAQIEGVWHSLLVRNAEYAQDAALWRVQTEPVAPYLHRDAALVEYFCLSDGWIAFVASPDGVDVCRLGSGAAEIRRLVDTLWLNLRAVPGSSPGRLAALTRHACAALERLYQALWSPLEPLLGQARHVFIVPHGVLHYLPFHALYDGERFLAERRVVSYLPAASLLRYVVSHARRPLAGGALAVGCSLDGLLPHAVREARAVAQLWDGDVLLEEEATLDRVREEMAQYRIVHLATHGEFRPDHPLFSGLALADGWLTTLDVFNLRLDASLVTLSACQTGRSLVSGGDELLGLMRAFLAAGSASLVLSLWPVVDEMAAMLMMAFYQMIHAGHPKGEALCRSQAQFARTEAGDVQHPYLWAPFFLVGDPRPL